MQIEGKDNDQAGTSNSEISYSIVSQEPEGTGHMFTIDKKTGNLYVNEPTLDREVSMNTIRHTPHFQKIFFQSLKGSINDLWCEEKS